MSDQVKVEDLEVFRLLRAALLKFAQAAMQSLSNADGQISRMHSWLESEQGTFWQGQLRKRSEMVTEAREAVRQKKLYRDSSGRIPSAVEEEKHLSRCLKAVEQAEQKIEAVRKWLPRLQKDTEIYRSGVSHLGDTVASNIPGAVALLDRLLLTLEEYMQIAAPEVRRDSALEATATTFETMSRGGEGGAEKQVAPVSRPPEEKSSSGADEAGNTGESAVQKEA